ncbi:MAG: type II secretion system F family protein [Actinomycetota bacterium]
MNGQGALAAALVLATLACLRAAMAGRCRVAATARARSLAPPAAAPSRRPLLLPPPAGLASRLEEAAVPADPATAWTLWLAGGAAAGAWALGAAGPGLAVLVAAAAAGAPGLAWRLLRHRGTAALEAALPGAVDSIAAGLRSGASLRQAVAEAGWATPGPLGADLRAVATAVDRGAGPGAALEGWAARRPQAGVRLVVAALCLGAETGGATARAVDAVAATLRQRLAAQAEARALATQARASAGVIAVAPLAFCALSTATDPRSAGFLLRTPTGLVLLSAGLALDAAGAVWMARLTRVEA